MNEKARKELAMFLGDEDRDFAVDPFTQDEVLAAINVYSKGLEDGNTDPNLKALYWECLKVLKKYLYIH